MWVKVANFDDGRVTYRRAAEVDLVWEDDESVCVLFNGKGAYMLLDVKDSIEAVMRDAMKIAEKKIAEGNNHD